MKKLFLNTENAYTLDSTAITASTFKVQLSIIGEDGFPLLNAAGNQLIFSNASPQPTGTLPLAYTSSKFTATFTLATNTARQYGRAYWLAKTSADVDVLLTGYSPEELSIEPSVIDALQVREQMICPASYFTDAFLGALPSISEQLINIIAELNAKNPDILKNELLASQSTLERQLRANFFLTSHNITRDFYGEEFYANYWLQQVDWLPLHSVDSYKLLYGAQDIELSNELAPAMLPNKELGTIEWVPTSINGTLFTMIISQVSGIAASMIAMGNPSRIPALFRITYTAGMDFPNLDIAKKEELRRAVCRNAFMQLKPRIDPIMREKSLSLSVDGLSRSTSGGLDSIIKQFQEDETKWIASMRMELGTQMYMGIA